MDTINDRIEAIIKERFNGNKAAFARKIGYPATSLSSYIGKQRRSKPGVDMLAKIVTNIDVDARWLLIGEESKHDNNTTVIAENHSQASTSGNINVNTGISSAREQEIAVLYERIKGLEELIHSQRETIAALKTALNLR